MKGCENISIITDATGASQATANQDNLSAGVSASQEMAKTDLDRMKRYKNMIIEVGREKRVDPALIAGIISRESRAGNALVNGKGDHGKAWGLMQVDLTKEGGNQKAIGAWDSKEHLLHGTSRLIYFAGRICNKFGNWTEAQQLKGTIAAYNMGDGNVHSYQNVDEHTTGRDYSNDVVVRAQWYKRHLFG